jgi:trigger factor
MGQSIEVGSGKFFKEAEQALIQKKVGQKIDVKITVPDNFPEEDFRGKTALLSISIEGIKNRKRPALDDEFAKDVSDRFETLEDLKAAIVASLTEQKTQKEDLEKRNAAVLALIENNFFEVPKSLINRQAEFSASRVLGQMPKKQAEQIWQKIGQQLIEEAKPQALKTVQASLLCEAIAKMQNIVISPEDIDAELEKEAQRMNITKQRLKSQYKADDFEQLRFRLSNEKALDVVLEHAFIKNVEKPFGA